MLFNSYIFLFCFLPLSLVGYFLLNRYKHYELAKYFLTGMSLWFYAYFNTSYLWIILTSILVNYCCHCVMLSFSRYKKLSFFTGLIFNLGLLFYFKYFNFFIENLNLLFQNNMTFKKILLPLGISFFTFQQVGFLIDTRKGLVEKQSFSDYALFVTFFPQLIAGPIVTHWEMLPQFKEEGLKRPCARNMYTGFRILVLGLFKKVLLADTFGGAVAWGYANYHLLYGTDAALLVLFYTLQLYFDFSGYCDMARGIGYLFNIHIPVNFTSPYKAENIPDFWNRWHKTLTRFFTTYIYIPLGGNRKGTARTYRNIFIVFLISGIWHGAGYTFILWGILHGVLSILTSLFHRLKQHFPFKKSRGPAASIRKAFAVIVTFFVINLTWVFFRADSVSQALTILRHLWNPSQHIGIAEMASFFNLPEIWYVLKFSGLSSLRIASYLPMLAFCLFSLFLIWGCRNIAETEASFRPTAAGCLALSLLFLWCVVSLSGVSSFLYFNF